MPQPVKNTLEALKPPTFSTASRSICAFWVRFGHCGLQSLVQQLEQRTGFRVSAHLVELFGLCPRCLTGAG